MKEDVKQCIEKFFKMHKRVTIELKDLIEDKTLSHQETITKINELLEFLYGIDMTMYITNRQSYQIDIINDDKERERSLKLDYEGFCNLVKTYSHPMTVIPRLSDNCSLTSISYQFTNEQLVFIDPKNIVLTYGE